MPKLLVIKPSSLGDIVHGLQVVQSFREQTDGWEVSWVAREIFAPLVKACPTVDHLYTFHRDGGVLAFIALMRKIRAEQWDAVWDMQGLARSGLLTMAARAPAKLGRPDAREFASLAYASKVAEPEGPHALDRLLEFLKSAGVERKLPHKLPFKQTMDSSSELASIVEQRPIVLFPESRRTKKVWPHFDELAAMLSKMPDKQLVVWAGSHKLASPPVDTPRVINLSGKTSLEHLPELISNAKLVISNDSGPMHLAAALGKPLIALFGPTDPNLYGPYPLDCDRHTVMRAENGDLSELDPESVFKTCEKILL